MNRTQLYLVGLLVVQVVLILVFRSPFAGASAAYETRALLPALDAVTPSRIEILGADEESIELVKRDGQWRVDELGGFPADGQKIEDLLGDLQDVRVRRPVVSSGRYHASFKVAEDGHEARIRLWDDDDDEPDVDLILGSSPNFRSTHVRLAGEDAVYEARGLSPYDIRPATDSWIQQELVEGDATEVVGLTLTNESGSFELVKREGSWMVALPEDAVDVELDQGKVDSFVRTAVSLRLSGAAGPVDDATHGFADPAATLVVRWSAGDAGRELTLRVGGKPEDNESMRYLTRDGFGFTGTIWESSVRALLEDDLEQLQATRGSHAGPDLSG
jgi:hypothetical protein